MMVKFVLGPMERGDRLGVQSRGIARRADDVGGVDLGLRGGDRLARAVCLAFRRSGSGKRKAG